MGNTSVPSPSWTVERDALKADNERLRAWALKAYTVVEFCVGEGFVLDPPHYDADDLLVEGSPLLGVEDIAAANAAMAKATAMKTVTFWVVVQGDNKSDWLLGETAHTRADAIGFFLDANWHSYSKWKDALKDGWRVCKVTIPWEQVKP